MKRPSFEYPVCEHCGSYADKLQVSRRDDGTYQVIVFCHESRTSMILTVEDLESRNGDPLVKLHPFRKFTPTN